jgi:hypothetical protein
LEGIELVWLAAGDISKILGVPFQYEHPKMLALLEQAVRLGERYGAGVMYNLGLDSPHFDAMIASVGVDAVEWHLQMALEYMRAQTLGAPGA